MSLFSPCNQNNTIPNMLEHSLVWGFLLVGVGFLFSLVYSGWRATVFPFKLFHMFWWVLLNVYSSNTNNSCSINAFANNAIYYQVHYVVSLFDVKRSLRVKIRQKSHLRLFCSSPTVFSGVH